MEISVIDQLLRIMNKLPGVKVIDSRRPAGPFDEGFLGLGCPAEIAPEIAEFLASPGTLGQHARVADGHLLIGPDGTAVVTTLVVTPAPSHSAAPTVDAHRFWGALYRALGALGRGEPFTAHGHLEECRTGLLALYRTALAPQHAAQGWAGVELLPGAQRHLSGLTEWLVCPLEVRAQWRCAHKLAAAYEGLMLPLSERLGLPYPWAMRNLVFGRLDALRPDQPAPADAAALVPASAPEREVAAGPAKFKVKARRKAE